MVKRMLTMVYREIRGLHEAAYILALFTLASQVLALVRDRLLAHQFGASVNLDLYYTAFRIPDLLFVIFASVLSVYVLIPFVAEKKENGGVPAVRELLSQVFSLFLICYGLVALVVVLFAPEVTKLFFPGFAGQSLDSLVLLLRILLIQPLLLSISNLLGVVTQISQRFILYALSPILYNIGIIIGIIFLYPRFGLAGLAWGVVFGALLHVGIQVPYIIHSAYAPRILFRFDTALLARVFEISVPRALTLSLHQIVLLALLGFASVMSVGSVSVFQFAFNLQSVPLAIIGVSYSVAAFPTLARMFTSGDKPQFINYVASALRHIFFWSFPTIVLVIIVRAQLVRVILGSGKFNWDDTRLTAAALALFALSLAAQATNLLIVRAFYAGGNTRTPLVVTICSASLALFSSVLLYFGFVSIPAFRNVIEVLLRVRGVSGTEVLVLPLGYSIALITHTITLLIFFMRRFELPFGSFSGSLFRSLTASLIAGVFTYITLNATVLAMHTDTTLTVFLQGFIAGVVGLLTVVVVLFLLRSPELFEALRALHRRVSKATLVPPQQSDDMAV